MLWRRLLAWWRGSYVIVKVDPTTITLADGVVITIRDPCFFQVGDLITLRGFNPTRWARLRRGVSMFLIRLGLKKRPTREGS